jgi:hypothetical protein
MGPGAARSARGSCRPAHPELRGRRLRPPREGGREGGRSLRHVIGALLQLAGRPPTHARLAGERGRAGQNCGTQGRRQMHRRQMNRRPRTKAHRGQYGSPLSPHCHCGGCAGAERQAALGGAVRDPPKCRQGAVLGAPSRQRPAGAHTAWVTTGAKLHVRFVTRRDTGLRPARHRPSLTHPHPAPRTQEKHDGPALHLDLSVDPAPPGRPALLGHLCSI